MDILQYTLTFLPYPDLKQYNLMDETYQDLIARDFLDTCNSKSAKERYESLIKIDLLGLAKMYISLMLFFPCHSNSIGKKKIITETALKHISENNTTRSNYSDVCYTIFYTELIMDDLGTHLKNYLHGKISLEGESTIYWKDGFHTFPFDVDLLTLVAHSLMSIAYQVDLTSFNEHDIECIATYTDVLKLIHDFKTNSLVCEIDREYAELIQLRMRALISHIHTYDSIIFKIKE